MTSIIIDKKLNKAAEEIQDLIRKSRRKLLEFEIMINLSEIKKGKFESFRTAKELLKNIAK